MTKKDYLDCKGQIEVLLARKKGDEHFFELLFTVIFATGIVFSILCFALSVFALLKIFIPVALMGWTGYKLTEQLRYVYEKRGLRKLKECFALGYTLDEFLSLEEAEFLFQSSYTDGYYDG